MDNDSIPRAKDYAIKAYTKYKDQKLAKKLYMIIARNIFKSGANAKSNLAEGLKLIQDSSVVEDNNK